MSLPLLMLQLLVVTVVVIAKTRGPFGERLALIAYLTIIDMTEINFAHRQSDNNTKSTLIFRVLCLAQGQPV